MSEPRTRHTATVTPDGGVVVIGGYSFSPSFLPAITYIERWRPATDTWVDAGHLLVGRNRHSATLLPNGRILIIGGSSKDNGTGPRLQSVEIYDPDTGTLADGGSLATGRSSHVALLLDAGVLVLGGYEDDSAATDTVEWFDLTTSTWGCMPPMLARRGEFAAALIDPTTVLIAGGRATPATAASLASSEIYPVGAPTPCPNDAGAPGSDAGTMNAERKRMTLTRLPNGTLLAVGGSDAGAPGSGSELYIPDAGWRQIP